MLQYNIISNFIKSILMSIPRIDIYLRAITIPQIYKH